MCLSCGKGNPNDNHGNPDNITAEEIHRAALASDSRPVDVARRVYEGVQRLEMRMSVMERLVQG